MRACVCACLLAYVRARASMRACLPARVRACVSACVERRKNKQRGYKEETIKGDRQTDRHPNYLLQSDLRCRLPRLDLACVRACERARRNEFPVGPYNGFPQPPIVLMMIMADNGIENDTNR